MMKRMTIISAMLILGVWSEAYSGCADPSTQVTDVSTTLEGKLACSYKGNQDNPNERWSEQHRSGGNLWEWKRGVDHKIDPSKQIGTWAIDDSADTVTYQYGDPGSPYTYTLWDNADDSYSLCSDSSEERTIVKLIDNPSGDNPCGWNN
jgi:hypothetical protein